MGCPKTIVLNGRQLANIKSQLRNPHDNDPNAKLEFQRALKTLVTQADDWLSKGPWTVTSKTKLPPSGDIHDYTSQAPYWWPSENSSDGNPYVQRDGEKNPEVYNYSDRQDAEKVFRASYTLSLAWYYTSNESYARHAANILRMWFIDSATRMNPNLNHAQLIPHANTGRCIGIIDFSQSYTSVLDAAAILSGDCEDSSPHHLPTARPAPGWTKEDMTGFRDWNVAFLDWLTNNAFGQQESQMENNHGTFFAMQKAAIAIFVGDKQQAEREVLSARTRIEMSIAPDGSQPEELQRTRSWHYTTFNLLAFTRLAAIGDRIGIDLWSYQGPQGQSIMRAIEYLLPAATGSAPWEYPELGFVAYAAADIVRAAANAGSEAAQKVVGSLQTPPEDIWVLRPAPEQLDAVKAK